MSELSGIPNLHSTMYLLNQAYISSASWNKLAFTFHYVSIKSEVEQRAHHSNMDLHSTMYLLNRRSLKISKKLICYLHSTMYLLNLDESEKDLFTKQNLHSTMYLLNRYRRWLMITDEMHLHSTMYLLNHVYSKGNDRFSKIYIPLCIY